MERSPHPWLLGKALGDRLITRRWRPSFLGGVVDMTAAGVAPPRWLVLPTPTVLLLIGVCRLSGNAIGWQPAARLDVAMARKAADVDRRRHTGRREGSTWRDPYGWDGAVWWALAPHARATPGIRVQPRVLACP